ncbi:histone-lysine N-methyltransferase SETMAR [Trichonephila clavipes]|nr:histone-lysine N-methyltransferase SETMAR [Trichonephila clavipes]
MTSNYVQMYLIWEGVQERVVVRVAYAHLGENVDRCQCPVHGAKLLLVGVKGLPLPVGMPVVNNVNKITEMIELDWHVSNRSIAQELKINHKTVLNHLHKAGFKKKLGVWMLRQLTQKNMMACISICEALTKRKEINRFLK